MSQIDQISSVLKALFKQHNLTYKDVAQRLDMSEANVKRIFSNKAFTLDRLEAFCSLLNLSLVDFFVLCDTKSDKITQLTLEQEQQLLGDPRLFLVAVCVRDGWSMEEIITYYDVDKHQCIQLLAKLDRLNIIQLLPENKYKLLIDQNFRWLPNGPLENFIVKDVISQFLRSDFNSDDAFRFYMRGTYSQSSIDILKRRLEQVTEEAAKLNREDAKLPLKNRKHIGVLAAMRPWELSLFHNLRRGA